MGTEGEEEDDEAADRVGEGVGTRSGKQWVSPSNL